MKIDPLISVIIPVFNAERYVKKCVSSILDQTHSRVEILICDDGSSDRSREILQCFSDSRIRFFWNVRNQGYLRSVNFLASKATGEFLCFQDADDYSHPFRLSLQLAQLEANIKLGLVGTNYAVINRREKILRKQDVQSNREILKDLLRSGNPFKKPSIMFRRDVYETVGMYREEFLELGNISEDFDWILRASERFEVGNVNYSESLYYYRSVPTAMSKNILAVDQLFGHDVSLYLFKQRQQGEKDSLEKGNLEEVHALIAEMRKPYVEDKSLFYHRLAESLMYSGLPLSAVRQALMAVCHQPFVGRNYRLLQYCLRKSIFGL